MSNEFHCDTCGGWVSQLAAVTADRDHLRDATKMIEAERDTYKKALHGISLGSQNSMTSKEDLGREARAAIDAAKGGGKVQGNVR